MADVTEILIPLDKSSLQDRRSLTLLDSLSKPVVAGLMISTFLMYNPHPGTHVLRRLIPD